jgi:hypothetical protein
VGGLGRVDPGQALGEGIRHLEQIARIGVQVGVAGGMHIPLAAVETDRLVQEPDEIRRLEIARLPELDAGIARFPQQQGQPADFQIRAGADHEVGVAGPGDQGGARLDVVGILARRGGAGYAHPLAPEFQGQGGPLRLAGQDVDGRPGGGDALERQKQGQENSRLNMMSAPE